ncbi:MAG TPA: hypothetical protein VG929_05630 [Actinomycetota bacterium]|nr:hypothetical protein [Actinomycetota bacterium]
MPRGLKYVLSSFLVGALSLGVAWAGAVLVPTPKVGAGDATKSAPAQRMQVEDQEGDGEAFVASAAALEPGQILAGASKISLYPRPEDYRGQFPDARWEQDYAKCATLAPNATGVREGATHVADFRVRWAENPNCLYMGGYGIGPMFPITSWDEEYGLWTRSVAMSDGDDTVVLTLIDAVYWEAHYNSLCDGCGFLDLADQLGAELGVPASSFIFASTHSHTAPDFIGGWGAVPDWYMQQATDSLKESVRQAVRTMQPAVLEAGESFARPFNGERRDFYRSAEDNAMSWFRVVDADDQPEPETCTTPTPTPEPANNGAGKGHGYGNAGKDPAPAPTPVCEPAAPGKAIATVGAYPAHPVTEDHSKGQGDADFPAVFAKSVEDSFGGVGMFLQTGLGNVSPRGDKVNMGTGLASLVPPIGAGRQISDTNVLVGRHDWDQPVTNVPLGGLGAAGFFDRTFNETPAVVNEGKGGEVNKRCYSASPISVDTSVSAAKIGPLWITGGPGELFAGITNTIEEKNPGGVTLALGLVNDGLGYIIQSYETDHAGRQGAGFAGKAGPVGVAEYEDAYSIDHCFGDATLEKTLRLLDSLKP